LALPACKKMQLHNHKHGQLSSAICLICTMMKSIALAATIVWTLHVSAVVSEVVPFVMFNGGVTTATKSCHDIKWIFVMAELSKAFTPARHLGAQMETTSKQIKPVS
jgi:hypothetical protein